MECRKGVFFDGSNATSRILDVLEKERPKVICIDELEKMSRQFQNQLLNFLESGRIKVDQQRKSYDFEIKGAKVLINSIRQQRMLKMMTIADDRHFSYQNENDLVDFIASE